MQLAQDYGVAENAAVQQMADLYQGQLAMLRKIRADIRKDGMTVRKEYVKGRENVCAHPLVDAWIKGNTAAAQTLSRLADTIVAFGAPPQKKSSKWESVMGDE